DYPFSVVTTTDGGYVIAGVTKSFGSGNEDMWIVKTNSLGNVEWSQTFGGTLDDRANSVQTTSDDGIIIAGRTSSYSTSMSDMWIIKTNSTGHSLWNQTIGGSLDDSAYTVLVTSNEDYVLVGNKGYKDMWLVKITYTNLETTNPTSTTENTNTTITTSSNDTSQTTAYQNAIVLTLIPIILRIYINKKKK
ncbi:MAG: hypothetical protein ACXAC7_23290, partial [Candidatus Hodarchaeales archaeon]